MLEQTQATLLRFRNYVIQQSRSNLTKNRKNDTKKLYNSLKGEVVTEDNYSIVGFSMDLHGLFVDKGVKGSKSSAKAPNSPYSFKSKMPPVAVIAKWVKRRGLKGRDKNGRFIKDNTLAYLIARSIFQKGMKPSLFFTKPFEAGYKKYIDIDLIKAFGEDIETMVDVNL
jgi:hypothetical protein